MKPLLRHTIALFAAGLLLLTPAAAFTQQERLIQGAPPVEQPLVSEGEFALSLEAALGFNSTGDVVEAETTLGNLGIAPRNGWIDEYPVTPDIIIELKGGLMTAINAGTLELGMDEALQRFDDVVAGFGLLIRPYTPGSAYNPSMDSCATYPNPAMVQNSYTAAGTPIVTYYCPPPDYYAMYAWVPCPFWWSDLWFPGFFILRDFHKVVHVHDKVVVIRNHFNDQQHPRAYRIDPAERFKGKTFSGIGVPRSKNFISTGVPREERVIFNGQRAGRPTGAGTATGPFPSGKGSAPVVHQERTSPSYGGSERSGSRTGSNSSSGRQSGGSSMQRGK